MMAAAITHVALWPTTVTTWLFTVTSLPFMASSYIDFRQLVANGDDPGHHACDPRYQEWKVGVPRLMAASIWHVDSVAIVGNDVAIVRNVVTIHGQRVINVRRLVANGGDRGHHACDRRYQGWKQAFPGLVAASIWLVDGVAVDGHDMVIVGNAVMASGHEVAIDGHEVAVDGHELAIVGNGVAIGGNGVAWRVAGLYLDCGSVRRRIHSTTRSPRR